MFEDSDLEPAKGQLIYLPPDSAVDYMTYGGGFSGENGFMHMFPRGDVIVLGGIFRLGDSSRNVEVDQTERIVQEHKKLFDSFG